MPADYQLADQGVIRARDGLHIKRDSAEWPEYRAWLKAGGIPDPAPAPAVRIPTSAELKAILTVEVQRHLDATARLRGYDGILSAASYATSTHPNFAAEGQACVAWRDAVWAYCYQALADVEAGRRTVPTKDALISELPPMEWPT